MIYALHCGIFSDIRHHEALDEINPEEIKNLINNHTFLVDEPEKVEPVTPCMHVYKTKIQYDETTLPRSRHVEFFVKSPCHII